MIKGILKSVDTVQEEETELALHVKLCAQRYDHINDKFDQIDSRLDKIETTLVDIKDAIINDKDDNLKRYLAWAGVIITTLLAACGVLINHYILK